MGTTLFQGFHFPFFDQSFFMITDQIQNILTTGIGHIGCASSSLKPFHSDVLGVICEQNSSEIACCLNKEYSEPFLNNLVVGSMVSLFVGAISHEAYNVKGRVTAIRDVQENEKKACDKLRNGIYEPFAALGITKELADRYWLKTPDVTVVFEMHKIFIQTPGPDAGKQV